VRARREGASKVAREREGRREGGRERKIANMLHFRANERRQIKNLSEESHHPPLSARVSTERKSLMTQRPPTPRAASTPNINPPPHRGRMRPRVLPGS